MYQLNGLSLTDCAVWKSADFTFKKGLTDIRGGNRSGKSVLFSPIPACLYGVPLPKRGLSTLDFYKDDQRVLITAKSNGKNNNYEISVDGVNQHTETIRDGRAVIERLLPIPESLLYTTVHVSGLNKHPLALGKPAERLEWIQQTLADSQVYDGYAALVANQLADLKTDVGKAELLNNQIGDLYEPKAPDDKYTPKTLKKLRKKLESITPKVKELSDYVDQLRQLVNMGEPIEFDLDAYKKLKARVAELALVKEKFGYYKLHKKQFEKAEQIKKEITVTCLFLNAPFNAPPKKLLKVAEKKLEKAESRLRKLEDAWAEYLDQAPIRADREINVEMMVKKPTVEKIDSKIEALKDQRRDVRRHTELLESGKGYCPTCGSTIDKKSDQPSLEKIEGLINSYEKQKRKLIAMNADLVDKPKEKVADVETLIHNLKDLIGLCEKYVNLDLDESVEEVEYDKDKHDKLSEKLERLTASYGEYRQQERQRENISAELLKLKAPKKVLKQKQNELSDLNSLLLRVSDRIASYSSYERLLEQYNRQKESFETTLKELGDIERKQRVLKALKDAFSRDGLLSMRLDKVVTSFVDQLNVCAPFIWNEPFKFEIDIGPRRCDVIAHRNGQASTIQTFSGSEQRGWQLVSALALLRILPSDKRFDTIILDELEANMDEASQINFVHDYLPQLQQVVDKVVLVTPLSRAVFNVNSDRSYNVIKKRSVSTLEKA